MLEINLLAPRHPRRRIAAPPPRVVALVTSCVVVALLVAWSAVLITRVARLRHEVAAAAQEVARLQPLAQHVQNLTRDARQMRLRAALLQDLLVQSPASQVLETVRSAIPHDVGLTGLTVGGSAVTVEGYAQSYPSIEQFMVELENAGGIRHVNLSSSQRGTVGTHDVVKFRITGDLAAPAVTSQQGVTP